MGYIGDVYGRKKALVISIFLMAFPTFAMGCLPSYEKVGNTAIVLLLLTRMLQGMSVGGQLVSSLVFTLENHDPSKWGWYGVSSTMIIVAVVTAKQFAIRQIILVRNLISPESSPFLIHNNRAVSWGKFRVLATLFF